MFTNKEVPTSDKRYIASNFKPKKGISNVYLLNTDYVLYNVETIIPSKLPTLEESRGAVTNDFQKTVEKAWVQSLKDKAMITINEAVLERLIKTLK